VRNHPKFGFLICLLKERCEIYVARAIQPRGKPTPSNGDYSGSREEMSIEAIIGSG
jgi:hypothetical protein